MHSTAAIAARLDVQNITALRAHRRLDRGRRTDYGTEYREGQVAAAQTVGDYLAGRLTVEEFIDLLENTPRTGSYGEGFWATVRRLDAAF